MKRRLSNTLLVMAFAAIWMGCDTSSGLDDPNKSYFLKFYGGDGDQTGDDLAILPDGSFLLFGTTRHSGTDQNSQWYLVKTDPDGNILWEKTYGGPNDEQARDIELTTANEIILAGNAYKTTNDRDVKIMRLSLDGIPLDSVLAPVVDSVGVITTGDEDVMSITQTLDGYIVAGSTTYVSKKGSSGTNNSTDPRDALNLRFDNNLDPYANGWPKKQTYGYFADDVSQKIYQVSPTLFYVFGYTNSIASGHPKEDYNFWIYGLSAVSGIPVNRSFSGLASEDEVLTSSAAAPIQSGDGYFLGGITSNATGSADLFIAKVQKTLSFGAADYQYQKPLSIKLGNNVPDKTAVFASRVSGNFYLLANEGGFNNNQNWVLTKIVSDGSLAWSLPIVFGGEGLDTSGSLQELPDGRLALIGTMRTGKPDAGEFKMTLIKISQNGKFE